MRFSLLKRLGKKNFWFDYFAVVSVVMAFLVIAVRIRFFALPTFFLILGFLSYLYNPQKALYLFFFSLPLINSTPDIFFDGYPYNYLGISLFYLGGVVVSALVKRENLEYDFRWSNWYLFFLVLLWISAIFVFLRWSNLTLPSLAFFKDTPVCPAGDRFSFSVIFPVISLLIFSVAPYVFFLIRNKRLNEFKIYKSIMFGFFISVLLGIFQKYVNPEFLAQGWWKRKLGQIGATFSNPDSFGFFAGALFLYSILKLFSSMVSEESNRAEIKRNIPFLLASILFTLFGIFLSGSRTAFLFIIFSIIFIFFKKKVKFRYKITIAVLSLVAFLVAGGMVKKRVINSLHTFIEVFDSADVISGINKISQHRITMIKNSLPIMNDYGLVGVGTGNFLFYLKNLKFQEPYVEDLALNQYLLIFDEIGAIGLIAFVVFLFFLLKDQRDQNLTLVLSVVLFLNVFNNFFWFAEIFLLFWFFAAFSKMKKLRRVFSFRGWNWMVIPIIFAFVVMNIFHFYSLHPRTWAEEKGSEYDYGLWYREKEGDRYFQWTTQKSGFYIHLNHEGLSDEIAIFCGAPLQKLKHREQKVEMYWKGKLYRSVTFRKNKAYSFFIKSVPHDRGFVEFRIYPTFNLKELKLSPETRDLGIKVYRHL